LVTIVVVVIITIINNITIVILILIVIVIVIIMGITIIIVIIVVVIIFIIIFFIIFFIIIMNLNPLPNHFILSRCPGRNGKGVQLLKAPRRRQAADLDAPVALVRDLHPHAQLDGLTNLAQFQQLHQGRHKG
jgi:cell division protein FtsW (lipid II flippase)